MVPCILLLPQPAILPSLFESGLFLLRLQLVVQLADDVVDLIVEIAAGCDVHGVPITPDVLLVLPVTVGNTADVT